MNRDVEEHDSPVIDSFTLAKENWPFWVGIALITVGAYFAIDTKDPSLIAKLIIAGITELGFAFFIAHIVIVTVDKKAKKESQKETQAMQKILNDERRANERRLSSKLYLSTVLDVDLPNDISNEIEKYILVSSLLKKQQHIMYKIEPMGNYAKLFQTLEATYENVRKEVCQYEPPFQSYHNLNAEIEDKHPGQYWGLLSMSLQLTKSGSSKSKELINWKRRASKSGQLAATNFQHDLDKVKLKKPVPLSFGDKVRLRIEWVTPKYASDNEVFTNTNFAENLAIDVHYDKEIFEAGYRCIHPRASECMTVSQGLNQDALRFEYPFLPSNGVIAWWRKIQRPQK